MICHNHFLYHVEEYGHVLCFEWGTCKQAAELALNNIFIVRMLYVYAVFAPQRKSM
jgi:hypothetical protein